MPGQQSSLPDGASDQQTSVQCKGWVVALSCLESLCSGVFVLFRCLPGLEDRPRGGDFAVIGWLRHKSPPVGSREPDDDGSQAGRWRVEAEARPRVKGGRIMRGAEGGGTEATVYFMGFGSETSRQSLVFQPIARVVAFSLETRVMRTPHAQPQPNPMPWMPVSRATWAARV